MTKRDGLFSALLALLVALALPQELPAQQETERHYRVELIVVRHLGGSSDSTPQQTLRDLSEILDLYAPPDESAAGSVNSGDAKSNVDLSDSVLLEGGLMEEQPIAVRIDDMSDPMREIWRRLRGSAGFRPELFRAWEQSGDQSSDRPFPRLRIHDDEVLFTMDPATRAAAPTANVPVDEHGALVFSDATIRRKDESSLDSQMSNEPEPIEMYYRIDGTATLTRTRFLHLDLDIELREALFERPATEPAEDFDASAEERDSPPVSQLRTGPAADASAFRIHRIQQRRQVKSEQLEYFDGPVIGILALVTGFDVTPEIQEPETLQP